MKKNIRTDIHIAIVKTDNYEEFKDELERAIAESRGDILTIHAFVATTEEVKTP